MLSVALDNNISKHPLFSVKEKTRFWRKARGLYSLTGKTLDLGPYSWNILVLRVAPSNKILINVGFLLNLKKKVIQKAS